MEGTDGPQASEPEPEQESEAAEGPGDGGPAPGETGGWKKPEAKRELERQRARIVALQERLYADGRHGLLVVLQGMDASGKDGTVRHVFAGVNPQGIRVQSFKQPTPEEAAHDFLWRVHAAVPPHGVIGVFNRSHYEDVLVSRVHGRIPESVWRRRYREINDFERLLVDSGVTILKFCLRISRAEQHRRFERRLHDPEKFWKFSPADLREREFWDSYRRAYADMLAACSTEWAPWVVVPADHKWYRNLVVARAVVEALEGMDLRYPSLPEAAP